MIRLDITRVRIPSEAGHLTSRYSGKLGKARKSAPSTGRSCLQLESLAESKRDIQASMTLYPTESN